MFDYLGEEDYIEGLIYLIQGVEIVDLASVHIHALINHPGIMALDPGLEIPFGGTNIQYLFAVPDNLQHEGKSLPQDL